MCTPEPGSRREAAVILLNDAALDLNSGNVAETLAAVSSGLFTLSCGFGIIEDYRMQIEASAASTIAFSSIPVQTIGGDLRLAAAHLAAFHPVSMAGLS